MKCIKALLTLFTLSILSALASCSKGNALNPKTSANGVYYNSFTYTIYDTTGTKYTFGDTTTYTIDSNGDTLFFINGHGTTGLQFPAAYITQPNTPNNPNDSIRFIFFDPTIGAGNQITGTKNQITFYLPYYQYNLLRVGIYGSSPLIVLLNGTTYDADHQGDSRSLSTVNVVTTITDSSAGFVSGTILLWAQNSTNKTIQVVGNFDHVLSHFMLH